MHKISCNILVATLLYAGALAPAHAVDTADYPSNPIRIIVPYPAGGSNDMIGRYFGEKLSERVGVHAVIDNRGGANGIIGTEIAANAQADGYTLMMLSTSFTMNAAVRELPYDVEKSFDPIAMFGTSSNSIVVYPEAGFRNLKDIVERAKARPGSLLYASTGIGGFNHFGGELFKKMAGIDLVHVPYRGGGPAMIDVMGGQIPIMFSSVTQALPHVRTSKLKLIAIGADKRNPAVPDIPTFGEAGYPGYEVYNWWGIGAPDGLPDGVRDRLTRAFSEILADSGTVKRLAMEAATVKTMTPGEFRKYIREEVVKWTSVAKTAGIQVQ